MYGNSRDAYNVLMGKPEGRRRLGRPRHRWEDNIKMDFNNQIQTSKLKWMFERLDRGIDWIDLSRDRDR
jgi:hypothetical protein